VGVARVSQQRASEREARSVPVATASKNLIDDACTLAGRAVLHAFLDDVAGKLVLAHLEHLTLHLHDDGGLVLGLAMLKDVLDHVVAVLILHETDGTSQKLLEDGSLQVLNRTRRRRRRRKRSKSANWEMQTERASELAGAYRTNARVHLVVTAVLQDTLNDSAAVRMRRQSVHLATEGIDDELDQVRRHAFDALLDHVVTVLILDALHHVALELLDQDGLLVNVDHLQCLLQRKKPHYR